MLEHVMNEFTFMFADGRQNRSVTKIWSWLEYHTM